MSSTVLDAITALNNKAEDLLGKGHCARAIEKRHAAYAAAEALGNDDNLVAAVLQLYEANDVISSSRFDKQSCVECMLRARDLVVAAIAVLQRRRAAGTLLAGACRPEEVAWNASRLQHRVGERRIFPDVQASIAKASVFLGYEALLTGAAFAAMFALLDDDGPLTEMEIELLQFCASATDLMSQPRLHDSVALESEGSCMPHCCGIVSHWTEMKTNIARCCWMPGSA
jgi:hypothetical protein